MSKTNPPHIKDSFTVSNAASASARKPVVEIDFEKYFEFTKHFDMSDEQQRELLQALHTIMLAFVDMGFDLNPVQHAMPSEIACGQGGGDTDQSTQSLGDVVKLIVSNDDELSAEFHKSCGRSETQ